jgi:antirestriction protein
MTVASREVIEEQIENADKSYAVLSIYAMGYNLKLENWESFADDAEQTYLGQFGSRRTFAENYADRIGLLNPNGNGQVEMLARYFNYDLWVHDLFQDGTVWEHEGHYFQAL